MCSTSEYVLPFAVPTIKRRAPKTTARQKQIPNNKVIFRVFTSFFFINLFPCFGLAGTLAPYLSDDDYHYADWNTEDDDNDAKYG